MSNHWLSDFFGKSIINRHGWEILARLKLIYRKCYIYNDKTFQKSIECNKINIQMNKR